MCEVVYHGISLILPRALRYSVKLTNFRPIGGRLSAAKQPLRCSTLKVWFVSIGEIDERKLTGYQSYLAAHLPPQRIGGSHPGIPKTPTRHLLWPKAGPSCWVTGRGRSSQSSQIFRIPVPQLFSPRAIPIQKILYRLHTEKNRAEIKKPCISARLSYLAPRPGFEPGTCGLTVQVTEQNLASMAKNFNRVFSCRSVEVPKPNVYRTSFQNIPGCRWVILAGTTSCVKSPPNRTRTACQPNRKVDVPTWLAWGQGVAKI